jgi:hypothetical protein
VLLCLVDIAVLLATIHAHPTIWVGLLPMTSQLQIVGANHAAIPVLALSEMKMREIRRAVLNYYCYHYHEKEIEQLHDRNFYSRAVLHNTAYFPP